MSKVKKVKAKTHKATAKRFKITKGGKGDKVMHLGQGAGKGHGNSFMSRKQKRSPKGKRALNATKEIRKISRLLNN